MLIFNWPLQYRDYMFSIYKPKIRPDSEYFAILHCLKISKKKLYLYGNVSKWYTHFIGTYGVWKYATKKKLQGIINRGGEIVGKDKGKHSLLYFLLHHCLIHADFYIFVTSYTFCVDCKASATGRASQFISFCLTAYIRRITSEWLCSGQEAPIPMISAPFMTSLQQFHTT